MKIYIKNKLIKWGFKYWYRYDRETSYLYQLELYQGRKEKRELNLGFCVVLEYVYQEYYRLMPSPERYLLSHVFDNFLNSPTLIQKFHDNGLYGLSKVRSDRINMPQMKKDKEIKWGDYRCKFCNHLAFIKMVWQQVRDATQKPFGRNNICIDHAKIEGFFIEDSCKLPKWH